MKIEEVMKIFARGENQPNLFTIHFYFLLSVHYGEGLAMTFTVEAIPGEFSVCKLPRGVAPPTEPFVFFARTDGECSLVCRTADVPAQALCRVDGRRLFRLAETLDFSLVGVLARISALLAEAGIGIFALSTYDTDYILTTEADFDRALAILAKNGYSVAAPIEKTQAPSTDKPITIE